MGLVDKVMGRKPVSSIQTHVAGITQEQGRQEAAGSLRRGMKLILRRELNNEHDPNAVSVWRVWPSKDDIGYVPMTHSRKVSEHLAAKKRVTATVTKVDWLGYGRGEHKVGIKMRLDFFE